MADFFRGDQTKLVRGAARIMIAPSSADKPLKISDVIVLTAGATQYDPVAPWTDLGYTREGIQITVNNEEQAFDVDQVQGEIGAAPIGWTCNVVTNLAEVTLPHLIIAWEGAALTVDTTTTPNEQETGFAGASYYTERRGAVMFQGPSPDQGVTPGLITGYFFHRLIRAPQEGQLNFQKSGDAQVIAMNLKALADSTESDPLKQFFRVRAQVPTPGP
jgi:hypothetical protein